MNILKINLPILLVVLAFGLNACKKKCVVNKVNIDSGSIINGVIFYPERGDMISYITQNMGGNYVITASHPFADKFQVSINGAPKTPVNYSNYNIMGYPIVANCNAFYDRTVTVNNALQTVVYKIAVTQCTDCKEKYGTDNYVLVPAFPDSYAVSYDISYVDMEY